jgi:Tol biopolymer transport system component
MKAARGIALIGSAALVIGLVAPGVAGAANSIDSDARGQIVFQAPVNGHWQIFLEHADGSNVRRLVTSGDDDLTPSISPDGRRVVFFRIFANGSRDEIFLVDVDGSELHPIDVAGCTGNCLGDNTEGYAWSPDGTQIVFERALLDASGNVNVGLWLMNVDGTAAHQITQLNMAVDSEDHRPAWSPDAARLVFQRIDRTVSPERGALFSVRVDGTDPRQITPWALNANDPDWSPDGALIAFQSPAEANEGGEQNIYTIHPDGTGLTQLTAGLSSSRGFQGTFHPSWSPDGTQLVFSHNPSTAQRADLYRINRDGTGLHVVRHTVLNENAPDWGTAPPN